jgi:hypothetical protein
VLDDGVEDHPALEDSNGNSRVVNGYSVPGVPANGRPGSNRQHGQCCAGIIAATHSNNIRGIAPNVMIVPVNLGFEIQDELEWFEAMNWAWDPNGGNADILSNSWGPSNGASGHELYIQAINNAQIYGRGGNIENDIPGLGSIVVFSSGNNGLNEVSDYAKAAIAVGAINQSDTPAELNYSLKTDKRYTNIGPNQDLVAYGGDSDCQFWGFACNGEGDILTIDRVGSNGYTSGDYFEHFSGTSAACPQISGAAALILSINPSLSRTEVENMLFSAATDLGSPGKDNTYGYGKLNVYESCLEAVKSLNKNFGLNNNFLSYSKTGSDVPMTFVGSPGCGVASGIYVCDIYKAEGTMPQTSIYVGDGLSGANPNTGEYNVITSVNNDNINLMTFFYYVKSNIGGQVINRWVPQNPANLWAREYCSVPEENVVFNGTINSSENKELYASESIILSSGFEAKLGASFRAAPSSSTDEFICLSNPAQSMAFKSGIINQNELISSNEVFEIDMTDIKIYPNPSKGNFKVSISKELGDRAEIKIYNLNGELKFSKFIESKNQDFVFSEIPGVYLVKIIKGENIYYKKIVIQ